MERCSINVRSTLLRLTTLLLVVNITWFIWRRKGLVPLFVLAGKWNDTHVNFKATYQLNSLTIDEALLVPPQRTIRNVENMIEQLSYHPCRRTNETKDANDDCNKMASNIAPKRTDEIPQTYLPKRVFSALSEDDINTVQKFVFFVGYPRSGHSIVASMMDAHPNMVIAHEYNLFREWNTVHKNRTYLYNKLYKNSYKNALGGWRSAVKDQKGYTLQLNDTWQGGFTELRVIGDKSGGTTSQIFRSSPTLFLSVLDQLKETVKVPIRVIHVVRNPYDMIAARLLYADKVKKTRRDASVGPLYKHRNLIGLKTQINRTFDYLVVNVQEIIRYGNLTVLDVHLVDLVRDPARVLTMICRFLGVECSRDYIEKCREKVYKTPPKTRLLVEWTDELIREVERLSKDYSIFWRYAFDGD